MARIPERKFDPARPVYARKYFTAAGHKFVPGNHFDWQKIAVNQRRVLQMFDAGKLTHKDEEYDPERIKPEYDPERIKPEYTPERIETNPTDDLDTIEDMKELRAIADEIGAPYKVSKVDQRDAIRAHRKENEE